jgi:hypothetical protein
MTETFGIPARAPRKARRRVVARPRNSQSVEPAAATTAEQPPSVDITTAAEKAQQAHDALQREIAENADAAARRRQLEDQVAHAQADLAIASEQRRKTAGEIIRERAPDEISKIGVQADEAMAKIRASVTTGIFAPFVEWTLARMRQRNWLVRQETALRSLGASHVQQAQYNPWPSLEGEDLARIIAKAIVDVARETAIAEEQRHADAYRLYVEGVTDSPLPAGYEHLGGDPP